MNTAAAALQRYCRDYFAYVRCLVLAATLDAIIYMLNNLMGVRRQAGTAGG